MNQFDWEKMQENIEILNVTRIAGWLSGWNYRKTHVIQNASGAGTNYQIRITVHYGADTDSGEHVYLNGRCRTDFGDVRFTDDDGVTLLSYWMETKVDGEYAVFWVKLIDDLSVDPATVYLYYGKSDATTTSDGNTTFIKFIDFNRDGVISYGGGQDQNQGQYEILDGGRTLHMWGNNWKATNAILSLDLDKAVDFKFKSVGENAEINGIGLDNEIRGINAEWFYKAYGTQAWGRYTTTPMYSGSGEYEVLTAYLVDFTGDFNYLVFSNDADARQATNVYYSDIRVRKYVNPEPAHGDWGQEETIVEQRGLVIELRNEGSLTVHLVSAWVVNSTFHKRYDIDFFVNSGDTSSLSISSTTIPNNYYMVKVVTERGNIAVYVVE